MGNKHGREHHDYCPICKRLFPDYPFPLVTQAYINGQYITMCPLCYADDHLKRYRVPWNPIGKKAAAMYEQAKQYRREEKLIDTRKKE